MNEETKRCPMCERELPYERFNKRSDGRCYAYCKACQSIYARNHYKKDTALYKRRSRDQNRRYINRNRSFAIDYLRSHPCVECGENDPLVLEFDHIDPTLKERAVADLVRCAYSLERIKRELSLCEVRCIHCHRRRTAQQFAWNRGGR